MNKSESIGNLAAALSKLQNEIQNVYADTQGYGYKYAELSSILDEAKPLLGKHELAVTQLTVNDPANPSVVGVEGVLMHSSGEWISNALFMPVEQKKGLSLAQCSGVVITYIRRYQLAALLGIAQTDTDASAKAVEEEPEQPKSSVTKNTPLDDDRVALYSLIETHKLHDSIPKWCEYFKVGNLFELNHEQTLKVIDNIKEKVNG